MKTLLFILLMSYSLISIAQTRFIKVYCIGQGVVLVNLIRTDAIATMPDKKIYFRIGANPLICEFKDKKARDKAFNRILGESHA